MSKANWATQTISIIIKTPEGEKTKLIKALTCGPFAIHDDVKGAKQFTITHVKTGLMVHKCSKIETVMESVKRLLASELAWDFASLKEVGQNEKTTLWEFVRSLPRD